MIEYLIYGKTKSLKTVPVNAIVTQINGRAVMGKCESCGKWLYYNSKNYACDSDGYLCSGCLLEMS